MCFTITPQKGSPHLAAVNERLQILHQSGMINTWVNEHLGYFRKCDSVRKVIASNTLRKAVLTLQHVDSLFLIFCGTLLALFVFIVEFCVNKRQIKLV